MDKKKQGASAVSHYKAQFKNWLADEDSEIVKKRQNIFFFGGLSILIVVILGVMTMRSSLGSTPSSLKEEPVTKRTIETARSSVDQKKVWVERLESEMDLIKKKNEQLETLVEAMAKKQLCADMNGGNQALNLQRGMNSPDVQQMPEPPNALQTLNATHLSKGVNTFQERDGLEPGYSDDALIVNQRATQQQANKKTMTVSFKLEDLDHQKPKKSVDHYVPAGTFVKARLTSGVVASTAVGASASPQPLHMEMTHFGNMPRGFKTDVKRCFLIGSAYGDLASERVFMRLETLSCIERKTGEIMELKVDGYVSGEDGANGMRGIIVDKSGPAMRNAFVGGFLSGVGGFLADANKGASQISPMGITTQEALKAADILKGGAGKGVGNAMEKMADFYIKRAEQLQPVIEIEPGRSVDVVFKAGFDMNQTLYRHSLKGQGDILRRSQVAREFR
ncbi:MAG: TraB/VirB10 family protein [Alphaproteobacteria bacterium]|nr:TraB/VirB10 family protein [Alphaproteobacteria bacterium]